MSLVNRIAKVSRKTKEVDISLRINLDGKGIFKNTLDNGFLKHLLELFVKHSRIDLEISATADLKHHLIEDIAICLGQGISKALKHRRGIRRFGYAYVPMDDTLARAVVDLGGRSYLNTELALVHAQIEDLKVEDFEHFFQSLIDNLDANLHLHVLYGLNDHHKAEAVTKAFALALNQAFAIIDEGIPSTKGIL